MDYDHLSFSYIVDPKQNWEAFHFSAMSKKLVLFGAGNNAIEFISKTQNINISYICDSDTAKQGKNLLGIPIVAPGCLSEEDPKEIVFLVTPTNYIEILRTDVLSVKEYEIFIYGVLKAESTCLKKHLSEVDAVHAMLADEFSKKVFMTIIGNAILEINDYEILYTPFQYYLAEMFEKNRFRDEIIVDAGAHKGETVKTLINIFPTSIKRIYLFEPAPKTMIELKRAIADTEYDIIPYQYGLSKESGQAEFFYNPTWPGTSHLLVNHEKDSSKELANDISIIVETRKLDDIIPEDEKVTFIKMDIEGAEYDALKGAKETIQRCKPRLAICIYHNAKDYIRIPMLIKQLVPEYKLYIRHHSIGRDETVCYAFVP